MLEIHHSNCLEVLVAALGAVTGAPPGDPFRAEVIVVQNPGMARWINQQLAERTGISARLDYPLPAAFFWRVLKSRTNAYLLRPSL